MRFRLIAAVSLVALAPLMAGGARAADVLIDFSGQSDGVVVSGSSQPSSGMDVGPGSLSFTLSGIVSIGWFHPPEAAPAAPLSSAPIVMTAASHDDGGQPAAKPTLGGDEETAIQASLPAKLAAVSGLATVVTEVAAAPLEPLASGSQTRFVTMLPPAPTDWQDMDNQGVDTHNIASVLAAQVVSAVPEPASWALMLVGFGGMGALLRRRRPAAA